MKADKIREHGCRRDRSGRLQDTQEQMFRLRFQMCMGQTEGLKKYRELRKDRARMLTILRERELDPQGGASAGRAKAKKKQKAGSKRWRRQTAATKPESGHKNEKVGEVVSTKMAKTIVVEVTRRVPHPVYKRIVSKRKKFYAHDEEADGQGGRHGADHRVPAAEQAEALEARRSDPPGGAGRRGAPGDLDVEVADTRVKKTIKKK